MNFSCTLLGHVPLLPHNLFQKILANIEKISQIFTTFQIYLYLDPKLKYSIQQLELLHEFQNKLKIITIHIPNNENITHPINLYGSPIYTPQISNQEFGLNYILDLIEKQTPVDYIIIMDFSDYINTLTIDTNILKNYLQTNSYQDNNGVHHQWDILTFHNATYHNYNALSISDFQYYCWKWDNPYTYIEKLHQYYQSLIDNAKPDKPLINCDSAFNGLAIYRSGAIQHCSLLRHFSSLQYDIKKIEKIASNLSINPLTQTQIPDDMFRGLNFMAKKINHAKIKIGTLPIYEPSPITKLPTFNLLNTN